MPAYYTYLPRLYTHGPPPRPPPVRGGGDDQLFPSTGSNSSDRHSNESVPVLKVHLMTCDICYTLAYACAYLVQLQCTHQYIYILIYIIIYMSYIHTCLHRY